MAESNGFFLYLDQYAPIAELSLEQKGMLLEAMFAFNSGNDYEIADPVVNMAFGFFKATFERERRKYADICKRRKAAADARWGAKAEKDMQNMQVHPSASDAMQTMPYPEPEQEQEQDIKDTPLTPLGGKRESRSTRFTPPTPDEVQKYCDERHNGIDGCEFCDFYAARGWIAGKTKMKDWRAAIRTWERNRQKPLDAAQDKFRGAI